MTAGFLDRVVAPDDLVESSRLAAEEFIELDRTAHLQTKLRVRANVRQALRAAIESKLTTA